jgi:hypothetical protein
MVRVCHKRRGPGHTPDWQPVTRIVSRYSRPKQREAAEMWDFFAEVLQRQPDRVVKVWGHSKYWGVYHDKRWQFIWIEPSDLIVRG